MLWLSLICEELLTAADALCKGSVVVLVLLTLVVAWRIHVDVTLLGNVAIVNVGGTVVCGQDLIVFLLLWLLCKLLLDAHVRI